MDLWCRFNEHGGNISDNFELACIPCPGCFAVKCLLHWKADFHVSVLKSWVVPKLCLSESGIHQSPNPT